MTVTLESINQNKDAASSKNYKNSFRACHFCLAEIHENLYVITISVYENVVIIKINQPINFLSAKTRVTSDLNSFDEMYSLYLGICLLSKYTRYYIYNQTFLSVIDLASKEVAEPKESILIKKVHLNKDIVGFALIIRARELFSSITPIWISQEESKGNWLHAKKTLRSLHLSISSSFLPLTPSSSVIFRAELFRGVDSSRGEN